MSAAAARTTTTTISSQIRPIPHIVPGIIPSIMANLVLAIGRTDSALQALVHLSMQGNAVSTRTTSVVVSQCQFR